MKYLEFFKQRIPELGTPNERGEVSVKCIFHNDSSPSLSVNVVTGKFKCHTSHCRGHRGGTWKTFDKMMRGEMGGAPIEAEPISEEAANGYHYILLNSKQHLDFLTTTRGLSLETIKHFKLGWDSERYWIPIRSSRDTIVNVRRYLPGAKTDKVISFSTNHSTARLFPLESLKSDWVLLCEGEMDCLLAISLGYPAMTVTGGADTWTDVFNKQLAGKRVFVCYDTDKTGTLGSKEVAMRLLRSAKEVRLVKLPCAGTKEEKDLTDYFLHMRKTKEEFQTLLDTAEVIEATVKGAEEPDAKLLEIHLSEVGLDKYVNKRIISTVLIAGKDLAPFQVPRVLNYQCEMGEKICKWCGIADAGGQLEKRVPEWDPMLLKMVNVSSDKLDWLVSEFASVPGKCRKYKCEVTEFANIEAIKAIPEIDFKAERAEYVIRNLFYLGHGLKSNHTYSIKAVVMPEPKTQYATALIYSAVPSQDSIEKFTIDDAMIEALSIFRVSP